MEIVKTGETKSDTDEHWHVRGIPTGKGLWYKKDTEGTEAGKRLWHKLRMGRTESKDCSVGKAW